MTRLERCELLKSKGYTYDPETGKIYNVKGKEVKTKDVHGYYVLGFTQRPKTFQVKSHHYAWYMVYDNVDFNELDHINGDTLDNRISNLRIATRQLQNRNKKSSKGYMWDKSTNKWLARIFINRKAIHLGRFNTEQEAKQAYENSKSIYWDIY